MLQASVISSKLAFLKYTTEAWDEMRKQHLNNVLRCLHQQNRSALFSNSVFFVNYFLNVYCTLNSYLSIYLTDVTSKGSLVIHSDRKHAFGSETSIHDSVNSQLAKSLLIRIFCLQSSKTDCDFVTARD